MEMRWRTWTGRCLETDRSMCADRVDGQWADDELKSVRGCKMVRIAHPKHSLRIQSSTHPNRRHNGQAARVCERVCASRSARARRYTQCTSIGDPRRRETARSSKHACAARYRTFACARARPRACASTYTRESLYTRTWQAFAYCTSHVRRQAPSAVHARHFAQIG
eukprot:6188164-Pleurochrysis_carterae.AAC.1